MATRDDLGHATFWTTWTCSGSYGRTAPIGRGTRNERGVLLPCSSNFVLPPLQDLLQIMVQRGFILARFDPDELKNVGGPSIIHVILGRNLQIATYYYLVVRALLHAVVKTLRIASKAGFVTICLRPVVQLLTA